MKLIKYRLTHQFLEILFASFLSGSGLASTLPEQMKDYVAENIPTNTEKPPVVFFLQGSNGTNSLANEWAKWFEEHGVASIIIDSAGVRDSNSLFGIDYGSDLSIALDITQKNSKLDLSHYAVMGFSRGGTEAIKSGIYLNENQPKPNFIFALYPGHNSKCPSFPGNETKVFVFYGELDDWGTYMGNRDACKNMAAENENTSFYLLEGAHHGYDGSWNGTWNCCGGKTFKSASNKNALEKTRQVILEAIQDKWNLKK